MSYFWGFTLACQIISWTKWNFDNSSRSSTVNRLKLIKKEWLFLSSRTIFGVTYTCIKMHRLSINFVPLKLNIRWYDINSSCSTCLTTNRPHFTYLTTGTRWPLKICYNVSRLSTNIIITHQLPQIPKNYIKYAVRTYK